MADLGFIGNIFNPSGGTAATSQPTGTNVYQTNIPAYAQPYVQNMMDATQAQIFQTDASGNVTGFNPYQPYTGMTQDQYNAASQAVAGFSPLQQQAQSAAANLQMPGQYQGATNLAGASGLGALGTVGQAGMYGGMGARAGQQAAGQSNMYGGLGALAGQQGANIGQSLGQMSTDPNAVASYMNPYIQNALNPALQLSNQQYGMMGQQEQANATKAGAFGGTREALMAGLNQQNQMLANNQLIGNAYNTAFGNAQQQMNAANQAALSGNQQALSGYGMGLQGAGQAGQMGIAGSQAGLAGVGAQQAGYGQAGTAGANLANIGGQQLAAQQGILNTQSQQGALQQGNAQQIINQGIQNYATAQQYPLMELGTMSNMLHGLPMQAATTQQYQAAPSPLNQAVGVAGVAGALGGKAGGLARGIKGYALGGVIDSTQADLENMPTEALQQEFQTTESPTIKNQIKQILQARAGSQYAGGGIIAFADGNDGQAISADPAMVRQAYVDAANLQAAQNSPSDTPVNHSRFAAMGTPTSRFSDDSNSPQDLGLTAADIRAGRTTPQAATLGTAQAARLGITAAKSPELPNYTNDVPYSPTAASQPLSAQLASALAKQTSAASQPLSAQLASASASPDGAPPGAITNADPKQKLNIPAIVAEKSSKKTVEVGNNPDIPGFLSIPTEEEQAKMKDAYTKKMEAYLGPDDSAERLAKLDKRLDRESKMYDKNQRMLYASMWAKIGSTPGSLIQATLAGIQHAIPQLITNDEKRSQALNAIDDAKAEVNKAKRAEALKKWGLADDHTSKAVDHILKANATAASIYNTEKSFEGTIESHKISARATVEAAKMRQEGDNRDRNIRFFDSKLTEIPSKIAAIKQKNTVLYNMANAPNPNNDPKIAQSIKTANDKLENDPEVVALRNEQRNLQNRLNTYLGTTVNAPPENTPNAVPKVGETKNGYKFKGGNPNDKNNWEKQ